MGLAAFGHRPKDKADLVQARGSGRVGGGRIGHRKGVLRVGGTGVPVGRLTKGGR